MKVRNKAGFTPVTAEAFIESYLKNNSGTTREEIAIGIKEALEDFRSGVKCDCGNPIWVIGSAVVGNACFTCITGEADPSEDYEIDEVLS